MDSALLDYYALPGLVTCAGVYQLTRFAIAVGNARMKYKVSPPDVNGPPEFNRAFRAQQNALEFYPMSLASLWLSAVFVHPVPASLAYAGYLYARNQYFDEYIKDPDRRRKPFGLSVKFLQILIFMSIGGVSHKFLRYYTHIDIAKLLMGFIPSLTN